MDAKDVRLLGLAFGCAGIFLLAFCALMVWAVRSGVNGETIVIGAFAVIIFGGFGAAFVAHLISRRGK